jgi:putative inorganic carbon (HCO3(-)) transporter
MNVSEKAGGIVRSRSLAPQVAAATLFAFLTFLSIYRFGITTVVAGVLALAFLCVTLAMPALATPVVVFVMYSNSAAIAVHNHPALAPFAIGFFLLLCIPVINFVVLRRDGMRIDNVFWIMMVYLAIMISSAVFSRVPGESITALFKYIFEGLAFYFLLINAVRTPKVLRSCMWILLLVAAFLGGLAWIQNATKTYTVDYGGFAATHLADQSGSGTNNGDRIDIGNESRGRSVGQFRALGPVQDPNFFGQMLVAALPFALVPAFVDRSKRNRILAVAACVPILAGIIFTYSRGAGLAVLILGVCLFFLRYLKLRYALLFAVVITVVVLSSPGYLDRISSITEISTKHEVGADTSIKERSGIIKTGLKVFLQHPLLGVGVGQATNYIELTGVGYAAGVRGMAPHNLYLQLLVETGILGFVCFLSIAYFTTRNLLRASRYWIARRPEYAHICIAFMLAIIGFLSTSLFLHLAYPRFYWMLVGLGGAAAIVFSPEAAEQAVEDAEKAALRYGEF